MNADKALLSQHPVMSFETFPDLLVALTPALVVQKVNAAMADALGHSVHEIENQPFESFVFPEDKKAAIKFLNEIKCNGAGRGFVFRLLKKDDTVCYINWSATWLEKDKFIIASGRDETELVKRRQQQNAREHLFEALVENSFDTLALTDEEGRYLYVSDIFEEMFGFTKQDLLGTICFSYMHPDDLPRIMTDNTVLHSHAKKIYVAPYRFRTAGGRWLWIESVVTNQLKHPDIKGIVVSARDVTARFTSEARLKEMQLLEALQEGEEKERSRIARDLHDEISGMIAAAKMHFSSLVAQAPEITTFDGYQRGLSLLENAALQVRRTSHNLMPEILLEAGLAEALQRYCSNINSGQIDVAFYSLGENGRHSPAFELSLYRIAQELIGNVLKHSGATEALLQLSRFENVLSLTVEDNGSGFTADAYRNGTGLQSIRKRVAAMQGTIDIQSDPGEGTQIYLSFER